MIVGPAVCAVATGIAVAWTFHSWEAGLAVTLGLLWASLLVITAVITIEEGRDRRSADRDERERSRRESLHQLIRPDR
jgi:glucose uptake protein GlcU